ncbi:MAG: phosphodiesterase, partial [Anaerolineae bacterium]
AQAGAARPLSPTPRLIDIAPTVLHSLGLAVPETMQGRALTELLQSTAPVRRQAPAPAAESAGQAALNDAETADLQERLRGLGYL